MRELATIDRGDAVNLARNWLDDPVRGITDKGIAKLAQAVLAMDAELSRLYVEGDGGITQALVAMARANVIEECARVCDAEWQGTSSLCRSKCAGDLAKAIRAIDAPSPVSASGERSDDRG